METKYATRNTFKTGQSRAVTLPADWLANHGKGNYQIVMIYRDDVLVMATCEHVGIAQKIMEVK